MTQVTSRSCLTFSAAVLTCFLQFLLLFYVLKASSHSFAEAPSAIQRIQFSTNRPSIAKANNSNTSILDMWLKSWTDPSLLTTSPMGDILPEMLAALDKMQNPLNCSEASFLIYDATRGAGFGSLVKSLITAFHLAVRTNRVFLVDPRQQFFWTKGCDNPSSDGQLECFFQPLSRKCPYPRVSELLQEGKLHEVKVALLSDGFTPIFPNANASEPNVAFLSKKRLPLQNFNRLVNRYRDHQEFVGSIAPNISIHARRRHLQTISSSRRVWTTALVYYTLRLNGTTAKYIRSQLQEILKDDNPNCSQLLGLPIRGSDKCKNNSLGSSGEMNCVALSEIMDRVHRVAFAAPGITHAIVTSEDSNAISEEKIHTAQTEIEKLKPLQVILNHLDIPPETGSIRVDKSRGTPADLLKASLVTMHLQSLAEHLVISPRSNYHTLIHTLAQTTPGKPQYFMYPIGNWRELRFSEVSQFLEIGWAREGSW